MSTTGTVIVILAVIIGYGSLFGPPLLVLWDDFKKRKGRSP